MNGKDLLEAMSFIDESYIAQAEKKPARKNYRPLITTLTTIAACFALLVGSGYWYAHGKLARIQMASYKESAYSQELDAFVAPQRVTESVAAGGTESRMLDAADANIAMAVQVQTVTVQVTAQEDGFYRCTITDPGTGPWQSPGTEIRIPIQEDIQLDGIYVLTFDPNNVEGDTITQIEITPQN